MIHLPDRAVLRLSGEDARSWFANLVTCDIAHLEPGQGRWGALLTPQGKILFDFLATIGEDGLYLDTDAALAADFAKRLNFYRLRAKVTVETLSPAWAVYAALPPESVDIEGALAFPDPRRSELGLRILAPAAAMSDDRAAAYHAHRIELGVPEGGKDFRFGDAFPHEVLMDMLAGVDFKKGCFVGQEVVSRMQHRGTARSRIVPVAGTTALPAAGTEIRIGDRPAGTLGSTAGMRGLALLRLDRVEEGLAAGESLTAEGLALAVDKPSWWAGPSEAHKATA
ncbi:folate-binding protein YgfZ [Labrys sp. LIt4]|uniref:CAF17-like 4Fe-4S cluster assembly/insertion protein YgfZ n=1 Tax=Labrys sp. LIt4 TaxID=2821355 RepID=UPI001AE0C25E|nr:folate-binding protein YgfZ [Labrys sp. LIt4]MBP0580159.1 folate-binding protein YgfZ [Labrys sp. LIt4]